MQAVRNSAFAGQWDLIVGRDRIKAYRTFLGHARGLPEPAASDAPVARSQGHTTARCVFLAAGRDFAPTPAVVLHGCTLTPEERIETDETDITVDTAVNCQRPLSRRNLWLAAHDTHDIVRRTSRLHA